jgi:hypothetical protein
MTPRPHRKRSSKENRARRSDLLDLAGPWPCFDPGFLLAAQQQIPAPMTDVLPMATSRVLQAALQSAVDDGVFPGAQLAVRLRGELQCVAMAGRLSSEPFGAPVQACTIYDLASLTKPLATATSILLLIQAAKFSLEDPVQQILAELEGTPIGQATVRELLTHRSGLPGWRPFYERLDARGIISGLSSRDQPVKQQVLRMIRDEPLIYARGERSIYSDLGFMLLGLLVERLSGVALDRWCEEAIFRPLGADPLLFCPTAGQVQLEVGCSAVDISRIAPTEWDEWRNRLLCGEVHDENAACRVIRDCRIGAGCLRGLAQRLSWKKFDAGRRACQTVYSPPRTFRRIELGVGMGHSISSVIIRVIFFRGVVRASRVYRDVTVD